MGQNTRPMGLADRIQQVSTGLKVAAKSTAITSLSLIIKLSSGFFFGLVVSLVLQELIGYQGLGFFFVLVSTMSLVIRILWTWGTGAVLVFDLICILLLTLLRMYILIAP